MTARQRNQARANGTLVDPPKPGPLALPVLPECDYRGWAPIGKLHCNCSHQPEVSACTCPEIPSGMCSTTRTSAREFGRLTYPDGKQGDERLNTFRYRDGKPDVPRDYEVVYCDGCPHQKDPPPYIARLKRLGITGDHDPHDGHCDVLHVMPSASPKPDRIDVAGRFAGTCRECVVTAGREKPLSELVDATGCGLLIVYGQAASVATVKECLTVRPALKVWLVAQDARQKREAIPNVWYDLPQDLADDLAQRTKAAYQTAIARILE
jgi:hypothetical protein